jgi:transcriptional regulator with XRE-family HTH domain
MLELDALPFEAVAVLTALGERIALARRARGWTQSDLASKMDVSINTVVNIEKGRPSVALGQMVMALWVLDSLDVLREAARIEDDPVIQQQVARRIPRRVRGTSD